MARKKADKRSQSSIDDELCKLMTLVYIATKVTISIGIRLDDSLVCQALSLYEISKTT